MRIFLSRHRFLLRLFLLIFAVGGIAVLLVNSAVLGRAHNYMEQKHRERYLGDAQAFAHYVEEQVLMMYTQAARLNYDRDMAFASLNDHVYNQVEFINRLKVNLNSAPLASEMCIYFQGSDFVISSIAKYDLDYFTGAYLSLGEGQLAQELMNFICGTSTDRWSFFSTFGRTGSAERLLLRVPVVVPGEQRANVIYCITADSLRSLFISSMREEMDYAILDADGRLLYRSDALDGHLSHWQQLAASGENWLDFSVVDEDFTAFQVQNRLTYLVEIPTDLITSDLSTYYSTMIRLIWLCAAVVIVVAGISVYISYLPVYTMMRRATRGMCTDVDELRSIENALEQLENRNEEMNSILLEQDDILADAIMDGMLQGKYPDDRQRKWLEARFHGSCYTAATVAELQLGHTDRLSLETRLQERGVGVMVLSRLRECHSVLLFAYSEPMTRRELAALLPKLLPASAKPLDIGVGPEIDSLDKIGMSYACALTALYQHGGLTCYEDVVAARGPAADYPAMDVAVLMRRIEEGDEDGALGSLRTLQNALMARANGAVHIRFICHELQIAFIRHWNRLQLPLSDMQTNELILAESLPALFGVLQRMTAEGCRAMHARMDQEEENLNQRILDYVNEHYMDRDISLTQLSDVFGISIYVLSKQFKTIAGVGFREHIIAKRMDLAYQMVVHSDCSIREVAEATGVGNPDYLTKLFKMHYGATPSQLRQNAQNP